MSTSWTYGEDNDGWYVEDAENNQRAWALSEEDARWFAACANACVGNSVAWLEGYGLCLSLAENAKPFRALIDQVNAERDTYRELCVELQATVAKMHEAVRLNTAQKFCCGEPVMDNGYVCCGDEEAEWPDWALEAMRTADEMNSKVEQVVGVKS